MRRAWAKVLYPAIFVALVAVPLIGGRVEQVGKVVILGAMNVAVGILVAVLGSGARPSSPAPKVSTVIGFYLLVLFFVIYCWSGLAARGLTVSTALTVLLYFELMLALGLATGLIRPFTRKRN